MDLIATFLVTDRPIASIAFHAKGDILAVASGHKVLIFVLQLFCSSIMLKVFLLIPTFFIFKFVSHDLVYLLLLTNQILFSYTYGSTTREEKLHTQTLY